MTNTLRQAIERVEYEMRRLDSEAYQGLHEALVIVVGAAKRCEKLEAHLEMVCKEAQNMAQITNVNAQWFPMLQEAEKKIKKLEAQRAELRQAMVDTLDALEMPPSKSLFNDGMYQANATLLRKLDAQNGE